MSYTSVITGLGVISPAGAGTTLLFDAMTAGETYCGESAAARQHSPNASLPWSVAAIDPADAEWPTGPPWDRVKKYANSAAHAAVAAALQAVETIGLVTDSEATRSGTVMAVSSGSGDELGDAMPRLAARAQTDPRPLVKFLYDEVADYSYIRGIPSQLGQFVSMANGFRGSNVAVYGEAGANGLGALALAVRLIQSGELDRVMVVGVSVALSVTALAALHREDPLAEAAAARHGPFDRRRSGVLLGQGAAAVVLEREDVALGRGATPLATVHACEVLAAPTRRDALHHTVGMVLGSTSLTPDLWWANASGSLTADHEEWQTVRRHLHAPVTSSKGTIGNALECSALIDIALVVEALKRKSVPPIGLLTEPDPSLDGLDPVRDVPRPLPAMDTVLLTSLNHGRSATLAGAMLISEGATA